uniref:Protein ASPARTIC PROTEASE IN GUARD CELL 1 n=1 Tax=Noccaea caerulescens TaxID=107243 RepID=A0A1J3JMY1_NOCCA
MKNFMNIIIILFVCLCLCLGWGCAEGAKERGREDTYSHTIQISSLFPSSSSCVPSKAPTTKSSLKVVHRHSACSSLSSGKASTPDHADILRHDQARVESIRLALSNSFRDRIRPSQSTDLPAKHGSTVGSGNYIVTIGIGTPKNDLSLAFDTGSDLTWIQCKPCGACYPQKEPIFDPSSSSSYSNIVCSSPVCASLTSQGLGSNCSASNCIYGAAYGDRSITVGNLAKEKFTLTSSDVFDGLNFGCGKVNRGYFKGIAGLLGLGRGKLSFPSQTANKYNNVFSYCLPSSARYTGHLTFGSAGTSNSVKYTPISSLSGTTFYGINIVGITVGGKQLEIPSTVFSSQRAIIDSGTVISRLPPKAYEALRSAFKERMSNYTATTSPSSVIDTCYDFTGLQELIIPRIAFSFSGGTVVELDLAGILYVFDVSKVCLAFAGNGDTLPTIFGNVQQKTLQVVYDAPGGRIGFAPNGCS